MSESSRSRILRFACVMMAVLVVLAHPAIVDSVSAAGNGELTIDVEHKNGNQADEVNALIIYQDGSYYDEIKNYPGVDLKHTFSNLPTGHDYKVNAYIQDQFAGSTGSITIPADDGLTWWDESSKSDQITAENPIELSPTIYYSDGSTPIEGASVRVKSHEDDPNGPGKVIWRTATTESDGETDPSPLSLYPTDSDDPGKYTVEVLQDGEKISSGDYDELNTDVNLKVITDASVPEYDLSASADPSYAGDVDGEPFGSVEQGTEIQLTADPDLGHEFDHWSGDYPSGSREDADISVTVTEDKSLTAHFEEIPEYDLSVSSSSGGTVETSNTGSIQEGTDVSLTADATQGYKFSHWSGDYPSGSREDADISVTMYRDRELTANFEKLEGDLTVDVRHQNGDRAEEVNALVVWQDEVGGEPYKKFENNPSVAIKQKINNLPGDHRYKVNAYINDQFAGATDWVNIKNSDKSSTIRVDNPVWIKPTVYYTDGSTPLEDATVKIESHEGTQWRSSTTEEDGLTSAGKLWLFPTNKGHYDVQVYSEGSRVASKTFNSLDSNRDLRLVTSVSPPTQIDTTVVGRTVREETEQDGTITVGERTRVGATVRNDGTKMPLRVVFQFDTDGDSEPEAINISGDGTPERVDYDGDGEAEPGIVRGGADSTVVPAGKTQSFGLRYAPETAGDWQMRVVTQAKTDDEWIDAGTSDWDGFDVIETPEMRLTWDQAPPSTVLDGGEFTASVAGEVNSESELCITTVDGVDVTECISVNDEFTESFVIEENDIGGPPNRNYTIQASLTYEEPGAGYLPGIGRKTISTSPVEVRKLSSVAKPTEFPYTDTQGLRGTASVRDAFQIQVDRKQLSTDTYNITVTTQKGSALDQLNGQFSPGSQIIVLYNNNNIELQPGVESKIKGKSTSLYVYEEIDRVLTAVSLGKSTTVKILVKKLIRNAIESAAENWVTSMIRFESPPTYKSADNINYFTVDYSADDAPSGRIETFSKHRLSFQVEINDSVNRGNIVIVPDLRGKSNRITGTIGGNIPYQEYRRQIVVPVESDSDSSATLVDEKTTLPSGEFGPGDDMTATVTVENTGTVEETFHVGYTLTHRDSGTAYDVSPKDVTLAPGATQEVTLSWTVPETTQLGEFEATTAVWLDSTDEGLVGRQDDATETVTVTPDTPEFQNRAVYVWGYAGTLATNDDTANRFFERATDEDINTVFLSWGAFKSVSVSERAAFIKKAHKNNLQVHALIGTSGRTAVTNAKKTIPEIIAYNEGRDSAAQFDGIHLDAEPGGADVKSFLDEYRTLLDGVRTDIQSDSGASINSQKMALSAAVGPWWSNNAPTKTKQVVEQSALDYVVVMAYSDTEQEIKNRLSKITSDTDTPYVLAVETQEFTQGDKEDVTYYEEGQQDVKSTLQSIAGASSPGYLGSAYHFYQSSVSTWDALESASLRKTTIEPGDRVTVDTDVVFDDNFPQSSHRSQVRVEFDRQGSTYTVQETKTITPPGNQLTETSVEWQAPTDAPPGEYQVTASLIDTTRENNDREAVASRSDPITLDQIKLGTLEINEGAPSISDFAATTPNDGEIRVQFKSSEPLNQIDVELTDHNGAQVATLSKDDFSESGRRYSARVEISEDGTYTATLKKASDETGNDGARDRSDTVTIGSNPNQSPVPRLSVPDETAVDSTITLDASDSTDPDGDDSQLSYDWSIVNEPSGASVSVPVGSTGDVTLSTAGIYKFEVTVTDEDERSNTDTVIITVRDPPVASVTFTDQTIPSGSSAITIDTAEFSTQAAPDGEFVVVIHKTTEETYGDGIGPKIGESDVLPPGTRQSVEVDLSRTLGPSDDIAELTKSQSLVAMLHRADTDDGDNINHGSHITRNGDKVTSRAQVTVSSPPDDLIADAGPDQTITAGKTVELDASGSTAPDNSALSYQFQQVSQAGSAPDVSLQAPETQKTEFTAPDVDSETTVTFELTVTNSAGKTDTDRVNITITPPGVDTWTIPMEYPQFQMTTGDVDDDGSAELAVGNHGSYGPSEFGVVEQGRWVWNRSSDAAVHAETVGTVDTDTSPEFIFKSKVSSTWVRPYGIDTSSLWSVTHRGWPDTVRAADTDNDGKSEMAAMSHNNGYLTVIGDSGDVLWRTQSPANIEGLFGLTEVTGDDTPEILTHSPPNDNKQGLQLITKTDTGGVEVVWRVEPNAPVRATLSELDSDTDASEEVIAAYPGRGLITSLDAETGEMRWREQVEVASADRVRFADLTGDETPEVLLWSDTTLRVFSADSRSLIELSTSAPILRATGSGSGDGTLLLLTEDALISRTAEEELTRIQIDGTQVNEMSVGDTDDDNNPEVALGTDGSLRLYDNLEMASSQLEFPSTPGSESESESGVDVTRSISAGEVAPGEEVTVTTEITGVSGRVSITSSYEPPVSEATIQSVTVGGTSGDPIIEEATANGSTVTLGDVESDATATATATATVTVTESLTVGEETDITHEISGEVTVGETTTEVDPVSVTVANTDPQSVVDEYAGEDGEVGPFDVIKAVADFRQQQLAPFELLEVIAALRS